ncbi:MAG: hypothetical protein COV02_00660 [Candidatus Terrybacteria bacterium CG10_big_fil_rev_8_21_14_0_10_41_10]|uniref:DoxX subfamily n=1 Tax=Candidatus Terrybacteria bacterium CG10_big_fil_rev_8_21_14_0_10_41_10 TaxID=1975026 RepID=A0A2M8LB29_9BACT|nr:MAG: hypothetical protein COV02_00660 [Candidatus Terrybacteria bacterium CG10_big_fil_rev_8_21_14_0_10_41_10]
MTSLSIFLLRISMGWMFFYAGITKVLNPEWSAAGYLGAAKTFSGFYSFLLQPDILPIINMVNKWGLVLLGASLMLGLFVRFSSVLGILLMALYYVPILVFPHVGTHSYIVDEHIIYAAALLFFASSRAGRIFGIDSKLPKFL